MQKKKRRKETCRTNKVTPYTDSVYVYFFYYYYFVLYYCAMFGLQSEGGK